MGAKVICNKCGYVGDVTEFPKGTDFFQNQYIRGCPNKACDNRQTPGDASMRGFGGYRPFSFVREVEPDNPLEQVLYRSEEAS